METSNILFVLADQLVYDALGCTGSGVAITPNLDALAARGAVCDAAYSSAPVCTPYRISWLTGRHAGTVGGLRNEAALPHGVPTLAEVLGRAGYATSYVGKWHLGGTGQVAVPAELRGGFASFCGYQCYNDYINRVEFFDQDGNRRRCAGNRTVATTDIAIEHLERLAAQEKPWLLAVSYQEPHYPLQPEAGYAALFHGRAMPRRPGQIDREPHTPTGSPRSPRPVQFDPDWQRYGGDLDEYLRLYHALVCQLDAQIGRLLAELRALGLEQHTRVVFTADHGDLQGMHGLVNKGTWHECSARVPLLAAGPGIPTGLRVATPVGSVEWIATSCDWAGVPVPEGVHGRSIAPLLHGESIGHHPVFSEYGNWIALRDGPWKLAQERTSSRTIALHHLGQDPHELSDRQDDPASAGVLARLAEQLRCCREGSFPVGRSEPHPAGE